MPTLTSPLSRDRTRPAEEASPWPNPEGGGRTPAPAAAPARSNAFAASSGGVEIEYCVPGNLEPVARDLAAAIRESFGELPRLVASRDGVFEVRVDGRLVFSKRASWRLPDHDEIFYHVENR